MAGTLQENLRKIRTLKDFSQEYVAEHIGVSTSSYARYESGKAGINIDHVIKLARLYRMSIDEIVHFGDPSFKNRPRDHLYAKKIKITVELDGADETLEYWVSSLRSINKVISKPPTP